MSVSRFTEVPLVFFFFVFVFCLLQYSSDVVRQPRDLQCLNRLFPLSPHLCFYMKVLSVNHLLPVMVHG